MEYFKIGAEEGNADCQHEFGMSLLSSGEGVPLDAEGARGVVLLEHAAKQGHLEAEYQLAKLTYTGYGETPGDEAKAYRMFLSISESGSRFAIMAKYEVAMACFHGIGTQLDPERAVPLFDEFCHRYMERYPDSDEVLEAAYCLGWAYSTGRGVQQSWEQAVKYWEKVRWPADIRYRRITVILNRLVNFN